MNANEKKRIESRMSVHDLERFQEMGVSGIVAEYERFVRSHEEEKCNHSGVLRSKEEWWFCCGIDYEFSNDVLIRGTIESILGELSGEEWRELAIRVLGIDARLLKLCVMSDMSQDEEDASISSSRIKWWENVDRAPSRYDEL